MWSYTFYTFSKNGLELRDKLREYEDPARALAQMAANKQVRNEQYRADTIRHFHNFLAGAKSLVEHTRNYINEVYGQDELANEYKQRVKLTFGTNGFVAFVHDLRNYMLHKGIPIVGETMEIQQGQPPTFAFYLRLTRMRTWNGWTPLSRSYLNVLSEQIRVAHIVEPYMEIVVPFHRWLSQRRKDADRPALLELKKLQLEYQSLRDR
jgi:hypothetical protein